MDSRFAVFFFIMGGLDTYLNDCPTECLQEREAPAQLSIQYGDTYFQEDIIGDELYVSYDLPKTYGAFQPTAGISLSNLNDLWFGGGGKWTTKNTVDGPIFIELSLKPGIYVQGDGPELGYPLQFRGSLGAGIETFNGGSLMLVFDHRSNANATETNPGIETIGLRYAQQF